MALVTISTGAGTTVTEGAHAVAKYTLSSALTSATVVDVSLTGWGASAPGDYSGFEVRMGDSGTWTSVTGGRITLSAGVTEFSLRTLTATDTLSESFESVVFVVSQNGATVGIANSWWVQNIVAIADPTAALAPTPVTPVSISVGTPTPVSITESVPGAPTAAITTFTLSGALGVATSVSASVTGWGATAGLDYSALYYRPGNDPHGTGAGWTLVGPGGLVPLALGTTHFQLGVDVYNDNLTESYESVVFVVNQNASTVGITNSWWVSSQVNLLDPAAGPAPTPVTPVSISVGTPTPASFTESVPGAPTAAITTFTLSGALGVATSVSASVTGWGATAGVDYSALYYRPGNDPHGTGGAWTLVGPGGLVPLALGTTHFQLGVDVYNDNLTESYESVVFVVNQNAATVGIKDSWWVSSQVNLLDPAAGPAPTPVTPVSISVGTPTPASITESVPGAPTAAITTFTLSGALGVATSVSASVTGWGATAGVDYSALYYRPGNADHGTGGAWTLVGPGGLVPLALGTTHFQLGVDVYNDNLTESYESVVFVVNQNAATVGITNSWWVSSQVNLADPVPVINAATPLITSGTTASFAENGTGTVYTVTATDADAAPTLTYALGGTDAAQFSINASTGVVTFASAPNFEVPTDSGANNIYNITVTASDGTNISAPQAVAITVTNLDDNTPTITSGATVSFAENGTGTVYTAIGTDADADTTLTYSLGGTDALLFNINATSGAVTFNTAPNYENPTDDGANNIYNITVTASGGTNTSAPQAVAITVTNRDEVAPTITTGAAASAIVENSGAGQVIYTAASTDTGDTASGVTTYSLKPSVGDASAFSINAASGAVTLTANPDFETKPSYSFTVVATDAAGNASEQAVAITVTNRDEVAPTITTGAAASAIVENSGAGQVIYTAASTDSGDTASGVTTYSLKPSVGDASAFSINAASGAVTLTANPDFETKPSYSFTVVATDAAGNASEQAVSLAVTDLSESLAGQSVIDLGIYGKLIAPVQVDGGQWFYYWDRSGNGTNANTGTLNGGVDYTTHDVLDGIFNQDINGVTGSGGNTSDTYRFATINGVHLALPTVGGVTSSPYGSGGINNYQPGTAIGSATAANGSNVANATYNDLLAVWDAYNGTGAGSTVIGGTPSGWQAGHYWSATSSASGHAFVLLGDGSVIDDSDSDHYYVALQVL